MLLLRLRMPTKIRRNPSRGFVFFIFFIITFLFSGREAYAQAQQEWITYDRGGREGPREFVSAKRCQESPCVVTQDGAIKISPQFVSDYQVSLGLIHDGLYRPVHLFQQSSTLDERLSERLFNTQQNRKIFDLSRSIEEGKTEVIHLYGLRLHYDIEEGDPLILTLTSQENVRDYKSSYFRYHQEGLIWDLDLALIQPVDTLRSDSGELVQGSTISIAFSLSLGSYMDPEVPYRWRSKILHAWRANLFLGLLSRRVVDDSIVVEQIDGFVGGGLTLLDFFIVGAGVNTSRSPHSVFPFVGLEVNHVYKFLRSLKRSTHEEWLQYQEQERKR